MMKKIAILGSGAVAKMLATGFINHGYEVMVGTRDLSKLEHWKSTHPTGRIGSFAEAAAFGESIVLAVKGTVASAALQLAGIANIKGKIIMDATNPIAETPPEHGVLRFFTTLDDSLMERLQREFPEAQFVKVFNSVGNHLMVNPDFNGIRPTMFICGNHPEAKAFVTKVLDQFGWETEDFGTAEAARAIEPLCILWCIPGFLHQSWRHAFKLLKQ